MSDRGRLAANAAHTLRRYELARPAHLRFLLSSERRPCGPDRAAAGRRRRRGRRLVFAGAALAAVGAAGVAHKRLAARAGRQATQADDGRLALGWGEGVERPDHAVVRTPDGAELAVWDLEGDGPDAPVVVLPHCWGCSHEIWLPVARRLREQGFPRGALRPARPRGEHAGNGAADDRDAGARPDGGPRRDRCARRRAGGTLHGWHDDHVAGHAPARRAQGAGQGDGARGHRGHEPGRPARRRGHGWPTRWWRRRSSPGRCSRRTGTSSCAGPSARTRSARTWI